MAQHHIFGVIERSSGMHDLICLCRRPSPPARVPSSLGDLPDGVLLRIAQYSEMDARCFQAPPPPFPNGASWRPTFAP